VEVEILRIDPQTEHDQVARLAAFKQNRDQDLVRKRLDDLRETARGSGNLLYPLKDALRDRATLGEVCNVMREEFGEYKPPV
jgi:methylmalonyl-CoA mutase, N-terminal domain